MAPSIAHWRAGKLKCGTLTWVAAEQADVAAEQADMAAEQADSR
jgi:hypothetical protein